MFRKNLQAFILMVSALFSTLLFGLQFVLVLNQFHIWGQLGTSDKVQIIFHSAYVIILAASGWFYTAFKWRVTGFIHAALMLGIAGLVLYGVLSGWVTSPGKDNAAAGILAAANLIFIVVGAFATVCGIGVAWELSTAKKERTF
jgi:hypothetical protein